MTNEQLSEWLDGELDEDASGRCVRAVLQEAHQRETCELYWLIGDSLRGEAQGGDMRSRVMAALVDEPTVLAPVARRAEGRVSRLMPMAAAVAGVVFAVGVGLSVWSSAPDRQGPAVAQLQQATPVLASVAASSPAAIVPVSDDSGSDAAVLADERGYLMAHQASAMGSPMAGVAQYIRTVSVDQTDRR